MLSTGKWLFLVFSILSILWACVIFLGVTVVRAAITTRRHRWRPVLIGLAVITVATAVDRAALMVWRFRISHFSGRLERAARADIADPTYYYHPDRALLVSTGVRKGCSVPLLTVLLKGPKPDQVIVDGDGGLVLVYTPPMLAWSRHTPFLGRPRIPRQGSDIYAFNDIYFLHIMTVAFDPKGNGKALKTPIVNLEHGLPF